MCVLFIYYLPIHTICYLNQKKSVLNIKTNERNDLANLLSCNNPNSWRETRPVQMWTKSCIFAKIDRRTGNFHDKVLSQRYKCPGSHGYVRKDYQAVVAMFTCTGLWNHDVLNFPTSVRVVCVCVCVCVPPELTNWVQEGLLRQLTS